MKILHIASGDLWGGAEAQLSTLSKATAQLGAHVSVALLNPGSQLGERLREYGVDVLEFDETKSSTLAIGLQLLRQARAIKPDVIHTHRFKENIVGAMVARLLGVPSLRTVHGASEPELKQGTLRRWLLNKADVFTARYLQRRVIAVSEELAQQLQMLLPGATIDLIPNGVDIAELRSRSLREAPQIGSLNGYRRRVGYFGRLVPIKRLDLLLHTLVELRRIRQGEVEFCIVGDGPQMPLLQDLAARLNISDWVRFAGFQANAPGWIRSMDCVLVTSDHEGLPMIVLESLALGVPVVARAVGGIPEVLRPIEPAWLTDDASAQAIARSVANVLDSSMAADRHSSLLPERYTAQSMARSYMTTYESVLAETGAPPRRL